MGAPLCRGGGVPGRALELLTGQGQGQGGIHLELGQEAAGRGAHGDGAVARWSVCCAHRMLGLAKTFLGAGG